MAQSEWAADGLAAGQRALAEGDWMAARRIFTSVLDDGEQPAALEGLSWTHWWAEDMEACLAARTRAYHSYRSLGDMRGAARTAIWIGDDHLWFRGAPAVAAGWFARARRILAGHAICAEHGWLEAFSAHLALEEADLTRARQLSLRAQEIGRSHGGTDLEMFGLATEGLVMVEQGQTADGLRRLDEAVAAALAGEYEHLAPAALSCCLLLHACEDLRDDERAGQWCQEVAAFARSLGASFVVGGCRSAYGGILCRGGQWEAAEEELQAALRCLTGGPGPWRADALARLGELRRYQGRPDEARAAFEEAGEHWLAAAGLAALALESGDADDAAELAGRALRLSPPGSARRAEVLAVAVRSRIATGDMAAAERHCEELGAMAASAPNGAVPGEHHLARGRLASARGGHDTAAAHCADAVASFERSGALPQAGWARLELSRALAAQGSTQAAADEARRAEAVLSGLGARTETPGAANATNAGSLLTPRQVEVLALAAEGLTEAEMASRLVLSAHTVHRHLANIYNRLDCSSPQPLWRRPAASA